MEAREFYTLDGIKDEFTGKEGSPARKSMNLIQNELGDRVGVLTKIETETQYDWAMQRIEDLLSLVDDNTPTSDPNSMELGLLSKLAADYEDKNFPM